MSRSPVPSAATPADRVIGVPFYCRAMATRTTSSAETR